MPKVLPPLEVHVQTQGSSAVIMYHLAVHGYKCTQQHLQSTGVERKPQTSQTEPVIVSSNNNPLQYGKGLCL